jgi:hypothetical protein
MGIRINLGLAELNRRYTVFERNQVLSDVQLNGVTDYLNDQDRLSRLLLLGVGVHGGFRISLAKSVISITRGVGVTTDADLLWLDKTVTFSRFRKYGETAPRYDPFYAGDTMREVFELIADGAEAADAKPLTEFPKELADMVVVLFMESYLDDPDLCAGDDCDNLGKNAIDTQRVLMVTPEVAQGLESKLSTVSEVAEFLPELFAERPNFGASVTTTAALIQPVANVCESTMQRFLRFAAQLHTRFSELSAEIFGANPFDKWEKTLLDHFGPLKTRPGILYFYDHLKDLVDTGNELREILLTDDTVLCPDSKEFPKHLLLGSVSDPTRNRTPSYPSPLVAGGREKGEHARFLVRKLQTLIATFKPPAAPSEIRVTPSRTEAIRLEERAIPIYYEIVPAHPIEKHWNYRLARRNAGGSNLGYHAISYGGTFEAVASLVVQIARYDFFRVEGHIGQRVDVASKAIGELIKSRNLPFVVRSVLLHNNRDKIVVKPPIRFTDLHRLHYLLRADVATQLSDSERFNDNFKKQIDDELAKKELPGDRNIAGTANTHFTNVKSAVGGVKPAMEFKTYAEYRAKTDWPAFYGSVIGAASGFKADLGEYVRTDIATPFDAVASTNHPAWLVWLDQLIQARDEREDAKLLFENFIAEHPAFEHLGGVPRGGTLVLVYDDNGIVVADGALPYAWHEAAEEEPKNLPDLKRPAFKPPVIVDRAVKIKLPANQLFEKEFNVFKNENDQKWAKKIDEKIQETVGVGRSYFQFFQDTAKALVPVLTPKTTVRDHALPAFDDLLGVKTEEVNRNVELIDRIRAIIAKVNLPEDQQKLAMDQLAAAQMNLANAIAGTMKYIVDAKVDVSADTAGAKSMAILAASVGQVSDAKAKTQLQQSLAPLTNTPDPNHRVVVNNLNKLIVR